MRHHRVKVIICASALLFLLHSTFNPVQADVIPSWDNAVNDYDGTSLLGVPVRVKLKILLQGCYNVPSGRMSTTLNSSSYLPLTAPYCEDSRTVGSLPADMVDWIMVQLHTDPQGTPIASKSAFLRQDGYIVADDGTTNISVTAPAGNYYVAIVHRNHLTVMTSAAIALGYDSATLYDFTTGSDKCYGINGMVELEPGVWGMWSGDINHDGMVTTRDYFHWFESNDVLNTGYNFTDVNLDGTINNIDYSLWMTTAQAGATSSVRRVGDNPVLCLSEYSIDLGRVIFDTAVEKLLTITNTGTSELIITSINTSDPAFEVSGTLIFTLPPDAMQNITIRFSSSIAAHYNATLSIDNNSLENIIAVPLKAECYSTVTDIDGNSYNVVKIGNQYWMRENLKVTHYLTGVPLFTNEYFAYMDDQNNVPIYGLLYHQNALRRGQLAPEGWHIPTDLDWQLLINNSGGSSVAGGKLKEVGTSHWLSPNESATNETGFTALPGGFRMEISPVYKSLREDAYFWMASSIGWCSLHNISSTAELDYNPDTNTSRSIRCVKD